MTDRTPTAALTVLIAVVILAVSTVGIATAQVAVTNGTTFNVSDEGPTVTITEDLTLDSPFTYPNNNTVDLSPNATVVSNGSTNVTVDTIDGAWTNLTTHNVSAGLTVRPTDKQNVTIEGETVSQVNFSSVDTGDRSSTEVVYAADDPVNLTLTGLPASDSIEAISVDDGVLTTVSTDENGTATFELGAGDRRLAIATEPEPEPDPEPSGGGGGGGGTDTEESGDTEPAPTVAAVVETIEDSEPSSETQTQIESGETDETTGDVTVDTSADADSVSQISFDQSTTGTVSVSEYNDPTVLDTTADSIAESLSATDGEETTADDAQSDETTDSEPTENDGSDTPDSVGTTSVDVVTVTDISVSDNGGAGDSGESTPSTVTMTVDANSVDDPDDAVIVHETPDGWVELETIVASSGDDELSLTADTSSFSLFAVAEIKSSTDATGTNESKTNESTTADPTGKTDDGIPGFGIVAALLAVICLAAIGISKSSA